MRRCEGGVCALVFFFFFFFFFSLYTSQFRDLQHPTLFLVAECELYSEHQSENAREGEDLKAQEENTHFLLWSACVFSSASFPRSRGPVPEKSG